LRFSFGRLLEPSNHVDSRPACRHRIVVCDRPLQRSRRYAELSLQRRQGQRLVIDWPVPGLVDRELADTLPLRLVTPTVKGSVKYAQIFASIRESLTNSHQSTGSASRLDDCYRFRSERMKALRAAGRDEILVLEIEIAVLVREHRFDRDDHARL
jgi:hypothetical protein